jgi:hypothetical protein
MRTLDDLIESWHQLHVAGDARCSPEAIAAVKEAVAQFDEALAGTPEQGETRNSILSALRQVVFRLNEIGGLEGSYGSFIETDDREVLVPLLLEKARAAGLQLRPGDDPTSADRTW